MNLSFSGLQADYPISCATGLRCASAKQCGGKENQPRIRAEAFCCRGPTRTKWCEREHRVQCAAVFPAKFVGCKSCQVNDFSMRPEAVDSKPIWHLMKQCRCNSREPMRTARWTNATFESASAECWQRHHSCLTLMWLLNLCGMMMLYDWRM